MTEQRGTIGSDFAGFLREQDTYEETQAVALKRVLAYQLIEAMRAEGLTKVAMAERMATSRSQLDRLLDPAVTNVKLTTLGKAARAVGRELYVGLSEPESA